VHLVQAWRRALEAGALALLAPAALVLLRGEADPRLALEVLLAAWLPLTVAGALWGHREERLCADRAELESLAVTDPLTGLKNVRYFRARLAEACARSRRDGRPVALAVLDLDHFKRINDRHGHAVGDRALAAAACAVMAVCREGETAARIGGEELAVLMPGADAGAARVAAERIRRAIAARPIHGPRGVVPVTASVGVASTREALAPTPEDLFAAADKALFAAKASGRDRTEVAPKRASDGQASRSRGPAMDAGAREQQRLPDNYS
jgi:diguanylate cyclase (GGDEF)-like protein